MNKKQIDLSVIENELKGASAFFPTPEQSERRSAPRDDIVGKDQGDAVQEPQSFNKPDDSGSKKPQKGLIHEGDIGENQPTLVSNATDNQPPKEARTTTPRNHDTMVSRHHDTTIPPMVEVIRKAVKLVGKEAATHRFTPEEKQAIADIIYTNRRKGYDTSENEIARIAINWIVWDHLENGDTSILAQVLTALKE